MITVHNKQGHQIGYINERGSIFNNLRYCVAWLSDGGLIYGNVGPAYAGYIPKRDGVIQNPSYQEIGKLEIDGFVKNIHGEIIGSVKNFDSDSYVRASAAAILLFWIGTDREKCLKLRK